MTYDPADNSARCHALALATAREIAVRAGEYQPSPANAREAAWAAAGPVPMPMLDTVREEVP